MASAPSTPSFFSRRPLQSPITPLSAVRFSDATIGEDMPIWGEIPMFDAPKFDFTPQTTAGPTTPTASVASSQKLSFFMSPDSAPRFAVATPVKAAFASPAGFAPRTPKNWRKPSASPPRGPAERARETGLHKALRDNCIDAVREELARNPEALSDSFFDVAFEPPLCFALRAGVSEDVVRLLLEHGADPLALDTRGDTPAMVLSQLIQDGEEFPFGAFGHPTALPMGQLPEGIAQQLPAYLGPGRIGWSLRVARRLVAAGVKPAQVDGRGRSAADVARQRGNARLAEYWEHCLEFESCGALRKHLDRCSHSEPGTFLELGTDLFEGVASFLLPAGSGQGGTAGLVANATARFRAA